MEGYFLILGSFGCAGRDEGIKRFTNPFRQYMQFLPVSKMTAQRHWVQQQAIPAQQAFEHRVCDYPS